MEPGLLAASLRLVVAQRLLRLLCSHCKTASTKVLFPEVQADLSIDQHWVPVGCPACFYTGYRGRRAAFEVLPISRNLTDMIKTGQGNIDAYLLEAGIPRLRDTLTDWLREGLVSLEEVIVSVSKKKLLKTPGVNRLS